MLISDMSHPLLVNVVEKGQSLTKQYMSFGGSAPAEPHVLG